MCVKEQEYIHSTKAGGLDNQGARGRQGWGMAWEMTQGPCHLLTATSCSWVVESWGPIGLPLIRVYVSGVWALETTQRGMCACWSLNCECCSWGVGSKWRRHHAFPPCASPPVPHDPAATARCSCKGAASVKSTAGVCVCWRGVGG
jgi:hypothetical protein